MTNRPYLRYTTSARPMVLESTKIIGRPTKRQFERWIVQAVEALPRRLRQRLNNVGFVLEEGSPRGRLLGLYHGIPLPSRSHYTGVLPDKITIFRRPIERQALSPEAVPALVRHVVWHEVGHHFGFSDRALVRLERNWNRRFTQQRGGKAPADPN